MLFVSQGGQWNLGVWEQKDNKMERWHSELQARTEEESQESIASLCFICSPGEEKLTRNEIW